MSVLHLRCGSDIRQTLIEAEIDGDFLEWSDPLCRGPVPPDLDRSALIKERAAWLASFSDLDADEVAKDLHRADQALSGLAGYDRVNLWFEHDLYDQACLIALLSAIAYRPGLFLISTDSDPNHDRFIGFGQLSPAELAPYASRGVPVTEAMVECARETYHRYRTGDAAAIREIAEDPETQRHLPYLPGALQRHLQELPDETSGLSLTERLTLQALAEGAETPGQCFRTLMMESDPQPFLGDLLYWEDILRLATAPNPAVTPVPEDWRTPVTLTAFGRALLAGEACWSAHNPVHRWWGGRLLTN